MAQWIETKLRYDKTMENGAVKKVTEPYLVDALSFTEAEARITDEMTPYISGDFSVAAVKKAKIAEVFTNETSERWWKIRAAFINVDERTGADKRTPSDYIVAGRDIDDALAHFRECMKGTMADYEITGVNDTPLLEIFPAKLSNDK